jgi:hypothetical protein
MDIDYAQEQHRGQRAQALLEDELLGATLDAIEAEVIKQWEQCPARDAEGKEALWQLYKTSKKFRGVLLGYVETGKLATEKLKRFDEPRGLRGLFKAV